jgi:chemotaxis protein CheC
VNSGKLGCLAELARTGAGLAMAKMSQLTGHGIESSSVLVCPADLARHRRGPAAVSVGVAMTLGGAGSGHIMMMYEPDSANGFADLLVGRSPGTTKVLGEMERVALEGLGEVAGACFCSAAVAVAGLALSPSPPSVLVRKADDLLAMIAGDVARGLGTAYVAETLFTAGRRLSGLLLVAPNPDLLQALPTGLHAEWKGHPYPLARGLR